MTVPRYNPEPVIPPHHAPFSWKTAKRARRGPRVIAKPGETAQLTALSPTSPDERKRFSEWFDRADARGTASF